MAKERIKVQREDFDTGAEIEEMKRSSNSVGAIVSFIGVARDFSRGKRIKELYFEYYPGMAEKKLSEIREKAIRDFKLIDAKIIHRYGKIDINENIVLIITCSEHREHAFKACRWLIDELKKVVPIWKKEVSEEGEAWIEEHP